MKKSSIIQILFLVLTSIVFSTIVYYGFVSNYSKDVFSKNNYSEQYNSGVYKYRILSSQTLLMIDEWVTDNIENPDLLDKNDARLGLDDSFSSHFYLAYFIQNTLFLVLTAIILFFIFEHSLINISAKEKILLQFITILIISITQYVVVPYDNLSYFFSACFVLVLLNYYNSESIINLFIMGSVLFFATFNRESSALFISVFASVQLMKYGITKKTLVPVFALLLFFFAPYLILRFFIVPYDGTATYYLHIKENLIEWFNVLGMVFWLLLTYFLYVICDRAENKKAYLYFIVFSFPYILFCFTIGVMFETRLYVPIFIIAIVLSQINFQKILLPVNQERIISNRNV